MNGWVGGWVVWLDSTATVDKPGSCKVWLHRVQLTHNNTHAAAQMHTIREREE